VGGGGEVGEEEVGGEGKVGRGKWGPEPGVVRREGLPSVVRVRARVGEGGRCVERKWA
jgi:hypothetical protein